MPKFALFTDIHFGARQNETLHNQDCLEYISWFLQQVQKNKCDSIVFMGDWFENRNAINVETMDFSRRALEELNLLNIPVYFIVGNHDLYHRSTREIHSVKIFKEFANIKVIDEPIVIDDFLFCPYIFEHEYETLAKFRDCKVWFGHLEFKGFVLTGKHNIAEHGLSQSLFEEQDYIFCGHFHKRQQNKNVVYIGNTFPTNYGDSGEKNRGMAIYESSTKKLDFLDWPSCPTYYQASLSKVLSDDFGGLIPNSKMRIKAINDLDITYSEAQQLKELMLEKYKFREFRIEENKDEKKEALQEGEELEVESLSIDEIIIKQLSELEDLTTIKSSKLVEIYTTLC